MQRITITIDDELVDSIDRLINIRGYQNRSEAIRDLVRAGMPRTSLDAGKAPHCVGALVYVYEHDTRQLSRRLASAFHDHHDLSVATTRVPLNHDVCLEVSVLKGPTRDVQHFAEHVIAERGVSYGQMVTVPVEVGDASHTHDGRSPHRHVHIR
jgi:CopG family transcriptional regulator, nickel-responsive regulator